MTNVLNFVGKHLETSMREWEKMGKTFLIEISLETIIPYLYDIVRYQDSIQHFVFGLKLNYKPNSGPKNYFNKFVY